MFGMSPLTPGVLLSTLLILGTCTNTDSTSSSSSLTPIQVTIRSPNGTDLTPTIQILHSDHPPSTLQPRTHTTPIRYCSPGPQYTSHSWCERALSAQDYQTYCKGPAQAPSVHTATGKCAKDEICVGSSAGGDTTPLQAYCVSTYHFVEIGGEPNAGSRGVVTADFNAALHLRNGSQLAVEAVVTDYDRETSLFATSIVMQAQRHDGVWRPVTDGYIYCLRCASVTLAPFPATAQRVKVDVVMPASIPSGLLWLASYSY